MGDVVEHAVDQWDFCDDAVGDFFEEFPWEFDPLGVHGVGGGDGSEADGVVVGALTLSDSYGFHVGEGGEVLPDFRIQS